MEAEKTKEFNKRLSQWVAGQGFWFQVRYSMVSSSASGRVMFHLFQILFRLVIFLLLVAVALWIGLMQHKKSAGFADMVSGQLLEGLAANDVDMTGVVQARGQLEITGIVAKGENGTFFKSIEASSIRCKMGIADGLVGGWNPGVISIAKLDMVLIPGADDAQSAKALGDVIFERSQKVDVGVFEVAKTNLKWGFTGRTQGSIEGSWMRAQRIANGWRIIFKGGKFSQNWFRDLNIEKLVILCDRDGITFESAEFTQSIGTVNFSGLRLHAGARPELKGKLVAKNLDLEMLLPEAAREFMEGKISGEFQVFGSPNGASGIGYEGEVVLGDDDQIILRDKIHILEALSVMDYSRNYHRVDLKKGSFKLKTTNGGMVLSDVDLEDQDDIFTLKGEMTARLPTQREIRAAIAKREAIKGSRLFQGKPEDQPEPEKQPESMNLDAPTIIESEGELSEGETKESSLQKRLSMYEEMRMLELEASSKMSSMLKCTGMFHITIPADAFERAVELKQIYPVDQATNRIPMAIPIEGDLADITLKLAEEIYARGRR